MHGMHIVKQNRVRRSRVQWCQGSFLEQPVWAAFSSALELEQVSDCIEEDTTLHTEQSPAHVEQSPGRRENVYVIVYIMLNVFIFCYVRYMFNSICICLLCFCCFVYLFASFFVYYWPRPRLAPFLFSLILDRSIAALLASKYVWSLPYRARTDDADTPASRSGVFAAITAPLLVMYCFKRDYDFLFATCIY